MLILIEGCDGTGKTTLAATLMGYLHVVDPGCQIELLHAGPPKEHPLDEYEKPLFDYQPGIGHHIICDRWHLGEMVYPKIFDRESLITPSVLWHIESFLLRKGAIIVHVDGRTSVIQQRLVARGDDLVTPQQVDDIRIGFTQAMADTRLRTVFSDVRADKYTLERIVNAARQQDDTFAPLNDYVTYVGPRYPHLLLMGDVRNNHPKEPSPAFMPYPSTSGAYLFDALGDALSARSIGVANACDIDDAHALWQTLGEPDIVTLGKNAYKALSWANWPQRTVNHPQYVRRFHHSRRDEYAVHILEGKPPSWR